MKIVIIGPPSSGKTTFAMKLEKLLKINYIKGDELYWKNGEEMNLAQFKEVVALETSTATWIYEGHVMKVFEILSMHQPLLIVIQESMWDLPNSLVRDFQGAVFGQDKRRSKKRLSHHLKSWSKMKKARAELVEKYSSKHPNRVLIFNRSVETFEDFLETLNRGIKSHSATDLS